MEATGKTFEQNMQDDDVKKQYLTGLKDLFKVAENFDSILEDKIQEKLNWFLDINDLNCGGDDLFYHRLIQSNTRPSILLMQEIKKIEKELLAPKVKN